MEEKLTPQTMACLDNVVPAFKEAIHSVIQNRFFNKDGVMAGTERKNCYVVKIHDDTKDKFYGTVDCQEYNKQAPVGYHQRVRVTALQNPHTGINVMPSLYSDVVICQDAITMVEYVVLASHVDIIQMRSHEDTSIGVIETESFKEGDEKDMQDLKETGNAATTVYNKDNIISRITAGDKNVIIKMASDGSIIIEADNVSITGGNLTVAGTSNNDGAGPFCCIDICPYTGAIHRGSIVNMKEVPSAPK